jgi:hypothetical protein
MFDDFDPDLGRVFAQAHEPLGGDEFMAQVLRKMARAQRARMLRRVLVAAALVIIAALNGRWVLDAAAASVRFAGDFSPAQMEMLTSPAGWAVSMLVGAWVLFRLRPSRR